MKGSAPSQYPIGAIYSVVSDTTVDDVPVLVEMSKVSGYSEVSYQNSSIVGTVQVAKDEISGVNGMGVHMVITVITDIFFSIEFVVASQAGDSDIETSGEDVEADSYYTVANPVITVWDNCGGGKVNHTVNQAE